MNENEEELTPVLKAFRKYKASIPTALWVPELAEGFFKGWEAAEAHLSEAVSS